MGSKVSIYLKTSRGSPLCAFQYRVQFTPRSSHEDTSLKITIYGEEKGQKIIEITQ